MPRDLCGLIGSYVQLADADDKIKWMLAIQDEPEVRAHITGVVPDLDEILTIAYGTSAEWSAMSMRDRIESIAGRMYRVRYIGPWDATSGFGCNFRCLVRHMHDATCLAWKKMRETWSCIE